MDIKKQINSFIVANNINNQFLNEALDKEDYKKVESILQEYFDEKYPYLSPDNYKILTEILAVLDASNYNQDINIKPIIIEDLLEEEYDNYNEFDEI